MGRTWTRHTTFPLHPGLISVSNFTASRKHSVGMGMHHRTASRTCTTSLLALPGFYLSVFFFFLFFSLLRHGPGRAMHLGYDTRRFLHTREVGGGFQATGGDGFLFSNLDSGDTFFCFKISFFVQDWERFSCLFYLVYGFDVWMCNVVWIYSRLCLIPALVAVTTAVTPGRR